MTDNVTLGPWTGGVSPVQSQSIANVDPVLAMRRNKPNWIVSVWTNGQCQYFSTWFYESLAREHADRTRKMFADAKAHAFVKVELLTPELLERYSH